LILQLPQVRSRTAKRNLSMAKKNSGPKVGGKGRPTPKRNATNTKAQQQRSANRQWFVVVAVLVLIVVTILVLATIFSDPTPPPVFDRFGTQR